MRNLLLFMLLAGIWLPAQAQTVHIFYDAFHDSISYQENGLKVDRPLVKKGSKVVVHVTNYNDYLYELKVTTNERNYSVPSSSLASMLMGGGGGGENGLGLLQGLLGQGSGSVLPGFSTTEGTDFGFSSSSTAGVELSREASNKLQSFTSAMASVKAIERDIAERNESLQNIIERQEHSLFMRGEVNKLRNDASLSPNTSRKLMMEYLEKLLDLEANGAFALDDMLKQAKVKRNFMEGVDEYEYQVDLLEKKSREVSNIAWELEQLAVPMSYQNDVDATLQQMTNKTTLLRSKVDQLREQAPELLNESLTDLAAVRYQYEELKDHRFEKQLVIYPEGDITTVNIDLIPLNAAEEGLPTRTASPIKLESYGGLQINASVGISFASFFDRPQNYINPTGEIFGDELDAFSPIVTSFIHFYGQSKRNVSLAGTLGIGLGIGNQQGGSLTNYFLGPSLIIGKGQRIVLTSGLLGGKVDRLANGLEVGDVFMESTIPLKSIYELGFFVGVSFNVLGN